jgi:U3 small nucleolar RNA-associated protein 14
MAGEEVSFNDLIETLEDTNDFGSLKQMAAHSVSATAETSQAAQDRAKLSATYSVAKGAVSAWAPLVKQAQSRRTQVFEDRPAMEQFTPGKTTFGSEIDDLLKAQKLTPESELALEDESNAVLTEDEMRARMESVARLRSLQFFNEEKAKRWKKIKSKMFRKLHKKDLAELTMEELAEIDPDGVQKRIEKMEADRAKERATLRHKNTSQWVRRVLARGLKAAEGDAKEHFEEQLRIGVELTRKIKGYDGGDDDEGDEEELKKEHEEIVTKDKGLTRLFEMKFMKEAEERKEQELEELKKSLEEPDDTPASGIVTIRSEQTTPGLKRKSARAVPEEKPTPPPPPPPPTQEEAPEKQEIEEEEADKEKNPWLARRKKKGRRLVSATGFHQPTQEELAAAAKRISLARNESQKEVLMDAFGLSEEFQKEKEAEARKESEKGLVDMDSLHLPGWGSWTGPGVVESAGAKRRREALEAERKQITEEALRARKDSQMPHVMLHEGNDPAVERYSIPMVPRAYTSAKQLQVQLAYPMGPEVNSVSGFRQMTAPDMIAEAGHAIEPVFHTKMRKQKEKIQKRRAGRKALEDRKSSAV